MANPKSPRRLLRPYMRGSYFYDDKRLKAVGVMLLKELAESGLRLSDESNLTPGIASLSEVADKEMSRGEVLKTMFKAWWDNEGSLKPTNSGELVVKGVGPLALKAFYKDLCGGKNSVLDARYLDLHIAFSAWHEAAHAVTKEFLANSPFDVVEFARPHVMKNEISRLAFLRVAETVADVAAAIGLQSHDPRNPRVSLFLKEYAQSKKAKDSQHDSSFFLGPLDAFLKKSGLTIKPDMTLKEANAMAFKVVKDNYDLLAMKTSPEDAVKAREALCSADPNEKTINPVLASRERRVQTPVDRKANKAKSGDTPLVPPG